MALMTWDPHFATMESHSMGLGRMVLCVCRELLIKAQYYFAEVYFSENAPSPVGLKHRKMRRISSKTSAKVSANY